MKEFNKLLNKLKKLNLPKNEFAIFGSGPIGIRKLRDCNDIDIIVKKKLWDNLVKKYPLKKGHFDCILIGKNIEVYNTWTPGKWDIDFLIENADVFEEIRFVKLKNVLKWKEKKNRKKDIKDIKIIKEYLSKNE